MTPPTKPAQRDTTVHHGATRPLAHAEDPTRPGVALCGTRLTGRPIAAAGERCVVCLELTRRSFLGR